MRRNTLRKLLRRRCRGQQIAILGFGYREQNLDLLAPGDPLPSKPVYGPAKGWSDSDRDVIQGRLQRMFKWPLAGTEPKTHQRPEHRP
jgi:hypothetical protein